MGVGEAERHEDATVRWLRDLPLDRTDRVFLSPLVVEPGSTYPGRLARSGLSLPDDTELGVQELRLAHSLRDLPASVGRYRLAGFVA